LSKSVLSNPDMPESTKRFDGYLSKNITTNSLFEKVIRSLVVAVPPFIRHKLKLGPLGQDLYSKNNTVPDKLQKTEILPWNFNDLDRPQAPWHASEAMKAMILAAGLGTRLLPLTQKKPKPLFPLAGRPLIDILIGALQDLGCEAVMINTHHLGHMIEAFVQNQNYRIPVHTTYEPTLLDTAGGIKNVQDFWDDRPFLVINGDIFTNIDLKKAYAYHLGHGQPVTMVLHDHHAFNNVWVDSADCIKGFGTSQPCPPARAASGSHGNPTAIQVSGLRRLAFTGIQIVDPKVLDAIPQGTPCSIIDI